MYLSSPLCYDKLQYDYGSTFLELIHYTDDVTASEISCTFLHLHSSSYEASLALPSEKCFSFPKKTIFNIQLRLLFSRMTTFHIFAFNSALQLGKQQHYNLGKWLRSRYNNLISDKYSKDAVFIRSTDVDRTLMSAEADLAGLFPPSQDQVWNPNVLWQPIPVHTIPESMDGLLAAKRSCPTYDYALKKYKKSEDFVRLNKRFQGLYDYLTEHTGRKVDSPTGANNLYNNLFIENLYNMRWAYSLTFNAALV